GETSPYAPYTVQAGRAVGQPIERTRLRRRVAPAPLGCCGGGRNDEKHGQGSPGNDRAPEHHGSLPFPFACLAEQHVMAPPAGPAGPARRPGTHDIRTPESASWGPCADTRASASSTVGCSSQDPSAW